MPVIFLVLGGSMFVSKYMKQRAAVEQFVYDAVRLCSRGLPDAAAQTCVTENLAARATICTELDVAAQVEAFDRTYEEEELLNPVLKRLSLLRADVGCTMEVPMPLFDIGALEFRSQAAMPMRLETEAMP